VTGRSQTLQWWLGGTRGKDDINQNALAPLAEPIKGEQIKYDESTFFHAFSTNTVLIYLKTEHKED
jgi:hypothetical protein